MVSGRLTGHAIELRRVRHDISMLSPYRQQTSFKRPATSRPSATPRPVSRLDVLQSKVADRRLLPNVRHLRHVARLRRKANMLPPSMYLVPGIHQALSHDEWSRGRRRQAAASPSPTRTASRPSRVSANSDTLTSGLATRIFSRKISLETVHHPDDDDQRAHADDHAADRDQADERQQP